MNKKAFTLIEVMVVLSILAIIAILAYNFFGGTMKEAKLKQQVTKIYNDMRTISDAMELMMIKEPSQVGNGNKTTTLVANGYLKSLPTMDDSACFGSCNAYQAYYLYDDMDGNGATNKDGAVELYRVTEEICDAVNAQYSGLTAEWEYDQSGGEPYVYSPTETVYCLDWGTDSFSIIYMIGWDLE